MIQWAAWDLTSPRGFVVQRWRRERVHRLAPPPADAIFLPCAPAFALRFPVGGQQEFPSTCSPVWRYLLRRLLPSAWARLFAWQRIAPRPVLVRVRPQPCV